MASLKFQDVIGFYQANNDAVYKDLKTAYLGGKLTPFVGAGLSVFCGYKLWPNVLKELSEFIPDEGPKREALEMIERFEYLEAAEHIQAHYHPMLRRLQGIVSYDKLEVCPTERLYSSAAWVLPYLFHNRPLMTTNFDGVLEYVFSKQGSVFERVVEPHDPSLLTQIRQRDIHGLFKLHGDIGKETTSLDRLVFTKTQYDTVYCTGGELIEELKQWYQNQTLLFLGCSLAMDKTMEVLRDVASDNPGIRHFAIVGCKKAQRSEMLDRFSELGIDAIFYDDSNHDAVRVILERLLEETDSAGYKLLCRSRRSVVPAAEEKRPLMFDSEYFPFSGRETELARLAEFCEAEDQLLWWAVTGPGGMGKSRLVFEFCKTMRKQGWQIQRFEANPSRGGEARRLEELPGWMPEAGKTIVVLDDVQAYMESVCAWMTRVDYTPRSEDLRILLLEREGKALRDSSWLGPDFKSSHLDEWCHSESFLRLEPMTDEQLMSVMTDYAKAAGQTLNAELLLKTLERVDPQFKRPLYAVAIADARCQGKDPTNWDRLQGICDRKVKISKTLQSQMELLLANACLNGILPLDQVDWSQYDVLQKRMREAEMEPEEFCQRLGILQTVELEGRRVDQYGHLIDDLIIKEDAKIILLSCPDLLKEHLVLKLAFEKKTLELLPEGWHLDPNRLSFLRRLWLNYPDRLKDEAAFWDRFFSAPPASGLPARLYASLLWGCTAVFPALAQRAVDALSILYCADDKDKQIAECYTNGLFILSCDQSSEDTAVTVNQLKDLYDAHSDNTEVAGLYAKGLFNLAYKQSPEERISTAEQLETLYKDHPAQQEIAVAYAQGLLTLLLNEQQKDTSAIVDRQKDLYDAHSDKAEIAVAYAFALVKLSYSQSPEDTAVTVDRLKDLYDDHSEDTEVAGLYAKGLGNLACDQSPEDRADTVERLRELHGAHSENTEVVVEYAKGLVNLSYDQPLEDCATTVERLKDLYDAHSENAEVAVRYAKGLFNLSCDQSPEDRAATVDQMEALYNKHSSNQDIAQYYADSLVGLAFRQTEEAAVRRTLARSRAVLDQHSNNSEIQLSHAQTWFNLTLVQAESDIPATVSDIAAFLRSHPDAIPAFREALDEYLSEHPDHAARYRPLLELGGDGHA